MTFQEKLNEDYKAAMKSGNKVRVETLRLLRAQLKDEQINKMRALTPEEEIAVLSTAAKKRREAIELYKQGASAAKASVPKDPMRSSKLLDGVVWDGKDPAKYADSFKVRGAGAA